MSSMVKDKDNSKNNSEEENNEYLLNLLKSYYKQDLANEQLQDFSEFFSKIEEKIEKSDPSRKISEATNQLEIEYLARQQRLESFIRRIDEKSYIESPKKVSNKTTKLSIFLFIILLLFVMAYFLSNFEINKKDQLSFTSQTTSVIKSPSQD
jgi:ABC-type multidrug transport system permease subunit